MRNRRRGEKPFIYKIKKWLDNHINAFYVAIGIIVLMGIGGLIISGLFEEKMENIIVGLGTGMITSALVTFLVDLASRRVEKKRSIKYKRMILEPLSQSIKNLYDCAIKNLNKYKMYDENKPGDYILLPCNDMRVLNTFFKQLEILELKQCSEEKKRKLNEMIDIHLIWYKSLVSHYKALPLETLFLKDVITREEYVRLNNRTPIETCERYIFELEKEDISEKERYMMAMQLMRISLNIMNKLIFMFDFIEQIIANENKRIKNNLDSIWFINFYVHSDEYIAKEMSKSQHPQEEYIELEEAEENATTELYKRLMLAIFMDDVDGMKCLFSEIDKNDKIIRKELTSMSAKTVMKNKELRKMYLEKYGEKYALEK